MFVCLTLLRVLQFRLEAAGEEDWRQPPPWNPHQTRPSVLDLERLLRRHAEGIRRLLSAWLEERESTAGATAPAAVA